ncbi:MAG: AAA family ATPase [Actinobacteria bacterium]|nr:AAA family ATPase [Actinomycetota bacterium]
MAAGLLGSILDLSTRTQVPALVWGAPGTGKSAAVRHWADARGMECWVVIASLREPSDFSGLPVVGHAPAGGTRASVDFVPPRFATEAAEKGGVIFLDELTTAPPAVQAALLRAVLDKAFGDLQLDPARVTIVAAANPPSLAAGGWDLSPPLANRFLHVDHEVSPAEWAGLDGFPSYWGSPPEIAFRGERVSEADWSVARSLVAGYIRRNPGALLSVPRDTVAQGRPWPSPRTWDFVSRMVATWKTPSEVGANLGTIAGCIGQGPAREFATYVREADLQDPEQILADPSSYRHPARGDLAYATMNSVMLVTRGSLTEPRWRAAWQFLGALKDKHMVADVAVAGARFLAPLRAGVADGSPVLPPVPQMVLFPDILGRAGV